MCACLYAKNKACDGRTGAAVDIECRCVFGRVAPVFVIARGHNSSSIDKLIIETRGRVRGETVSRTQAYRGV